jgi:hypothetical protein
MSVLIIIAIVAFGFVVFDLAAMRWGADSREHLPPDRRHFPPEHHY